MGQIDKNEDTLLVNDCIAGSEEAWRKFYSKYIGLMRNVARKFRGSSGMDSEDIVQSAFLTLSTALQSFDGNSSLSHFVCMITERVLIDELRKGNAAKRKAETQPVEHLEKSDDGSMVLASEHDSQEMVLEKAQVSLKLRKALSTIDEKCRNLLNMRYFQDMSFAEISGILGINENTLNVQTRRCLEKLRSKYND
jgi:RNA polymerase sigma factor (sigma-70 family)